MALAIGRGGVFVAAQRDLRQVNGKGHSRRALPGTANESHEPWDGPVAIPFTDDPMAYDSGNRLLLCTLVKGLGDAVRRDHPSAAERYRRRLRLATEQISADDPVHDVFERLLYTSGHWAAAAAVQRGETKQQMLEIIERVIELLAS